MSIDRINKVDIISTTPDNKIVLTISDHHLWNDAGEHLILLQDKVNTYLQFIESGQIFEDYPNAKDKKVVISVDMKYEPNETSILFLTRCKEIILSAGFEFEWRTISLAK